MDILLLGYYTRFSYSLLKWNLQRAKIMITPFHTFYHILSPPTGCTNWPLNKFRVSKLNWRQYFPCHNIHVYSTSIIGCIPIVLVLPLLFISKIIICCKIRYIFSLTLKEECLNKDKNHGFFILYWIVNFVAC